MNAPQDLEFLNSIKYILPEHKVENIEKNNYKYIFISPNIKITSMSTIDAEPVPN